MVYKHKCKVCDSFERTGYRLPTLCPICDKEQYNYNFPTREMQIENRANSIFDNTIEKLHHENKKEILHLLIKKLHI